MHVPNSLEIKMNVRLKVVSLIKQIVPVKPPGSLLHHLFCLLKLSAAFQLCYIGSLGVYKDVSCLCCLLQQTVAHQNSDFITWLAEEEAGGWKSPLPFWWAITGKNEPEASFICSAIYQEILGLTSGRLILSEDEHISVDSVFFCPSLKWKWSG